MTTEVDPWAVDLRHDGRIARAMLAGEDLTPALGEVAADEAVHPAARSVAVAALRLIADRGVAPHLAIEQAEQAHVQPARSEPGVKLPGLAARLAHPGTRGRADALAGHAPLGVTTDDATGAPVQRSTQLPGGKDD